MEKCNWRKFQLTSRVARRKVHFHPLQKSHFQRPSSSIGEKFISLEKGAKVFLLSRKGEKKALQSLFLPKNIAIFAANVLTSELEEARILLDTAERAKRNLEQVQGCHFKNSLTALSQEVAEGRAAIGEMTTANSILTGDRRRLEGEVNIVY